MRRSGRDRRIGAGSEGHFPHFQWKTQHFHSAPLCERGLLSHPAKSDTAARIVAGNPRFRLRSVRKSRTTLRQAQEVATRHEVEE